MRAAPKPSPLPVDADLTIDGPKTHLERVIAEECPALAAHGIGNVGLANVAPPFARVRTLPDGSFALACFGGEGRVLLEGRWERCRSGTVCLAPRGVLNAFYAVPGQRWGFAWVRYRETPHTSPVVTATSPLRVSADPEPLRLAVTGLCRETVTARDVGLLHHWVELVHKIVLRLAQPSNRDERLGRLWQHVTQSLTASWTLDALARYSCLSAEHLRRLCLRELGRSPMQHLTYMRMQQGALMLESSQDKLGIIAEAVGYTDPVTFSKVFKKWIGCPPSQYRTRR